MRLFHFSEHPNITLFRPYVAATSIEEEPFVWAIDEEHAPSYWFPRDCPRACCWAVEKPVLEAGAALITMGGAPRLHAIEATWLERLRACRLYSYEFDSAPFRLKVPEAGYWVANCEVAPLDVTPVGDLLARYEESGIELRIVRNLWPLIDAIVASGLEFSIIRKANAQADRLICFNAVLLIQAPFPPPSGASVRCCGLGPPKFRRQHLRMHALASSGNLLRADRPLASLTRSGAALPVKLVMS